MHHLLHCALVVSDPGHPFFQPDSLQKSTSPQRGKLKSRSFIYKLEHMLLLPQPVGRKTGNTGSLSLGDLVPGRGQD